VIGAETADLIEWRPSPWWTLEWLALMLFVGLPFVALGGWLAAREISDAAVPVWYTVFCRRRHSRRDRDRHVVRC
jgi:hypothetical protein